MKTKKNGEPFVDSLQFKPVVLVASFYDVFPAQKSNAGKQFGSSPDGTRAKIKTIGAPIESQLPRCVRAFPAKIAAFPFVDEGELIAIFRQLPLEKFTTLQVNEHWPDWPPDSRQSGQIIRITLPVVFFARRLYRRHVKFASEKTFAERGTRRQPAIIKAVEKCPSVPDTLELEIWASGW